MPKWDLLQECKVSLKFEMLIWYISSIKNKNYIIIQVDAGKAFDKIQRLFVTFTLSKLEIEENFLTDEGHLWKIYC